MVKIERKETEKTKKAVIALEQAKRSGTDTMVEQRRKNLKRRY